MNQRLTVVVIALTLFASVIATGALFYANGYRWNVSHSYPTGIYKLTNEHDAYHRGDLVLFCPPDNKAMRMALHRDYIKMGLCRGGFTPAIKKIIAMEGDTVSFDSGMVHINGQAVTKASVLPTDSQGRAMPQLAPFTLQKNEFFMMSDHRPIDSFDSRYYGVVSLDHLLGHIEPVWVW
ncbi:conjugative transfer signal peptidase TraF [Vibrio parahaemolyticus]|uniref:conjugative transfer signal peptidase TraF n=1 Tax=Vibrio parahaemolyticus TaxID=670 RepID=UPI00177BFB4D|nr:conjugative transfer signal peptidase TraF [Vibrio parahaemolyticus]MBD6945046.1 conjugative transfer signal peptidase TraF [Vibrio parahaemolyticus]MBD6978944.1 conjugative transfer signal peptidase TraF [Vibrio parahaemolyticus]MBD6990949.1 conjugative transfer signal peptidase TraF [Vibrio parahaemolyticus]WOZ62910.1 conjugative transfer signal peptidase TraF [Vibrio parahaemolyticus]